MEGIINVVTFFAVAFVGGLIAWGFYYAIAVILLWPRLLAKNLSLPNRDPDRIQKMRVLFLSIQFIFFLTSFLSIYLYSPEFFIYVFKLSLISTGVIFAAEIFVNDIIPYSLGIQLLGATPTPLVREMGTTYVHRVMFVPIVSIVFGLLVASHVIGALAIIVGIVLRLRFKGLIKLDEYANKVDFFIEKLQDKSQRRRILSAVVLGDIGGVKAVEALIGLAKHRPYLAEQARAVQALGELREVRAVRPLLELFWHEDSVADAMGALYQIAERDPSELVSAYKRWPSPCVKKYTAITLDRVGWKPITDEENIEFLLAQEKFKEAARLVACAPDALKPILARIDEKTQKKIEDLVHKLTGNK
ncbi:MAG: hypothetical protein K8R02_00860 [Anaerohalosphaeraceae bacterium]|nr:hypothetical protein [Anaerohalosphaeraceae bacterium]